MTFIGIKPVNVVHGRDIYIRSFLERASMLAQKTNINILTTGKPQTSKSRTTYEIARKLSKQLNREMIILFEFEKFKELVIKDTLDNYVIVYDEIQADIENWWSDVYRLLKDILERFGFRKLILFIITPRAKNVYALREYCQFEVYTELKYNSDKEQYQYLVHYSMLDYDRYKEKIVLIEFQIQQSIPYPYKLWLEALKLKEISYKKFLKNKISSFIGGSGKPHRHSWIHSVRKEQMRCKFCPVVVDDATWKRNYMKV